MWASFLKKKRKQTKPKNQNNKTLDLIDHSWELITPAGPTATSAVLQSCALQVSKPIWAQHLEAAAEGKVTWKDLCSTPKGAILHWKDL